MHPHPAVTANAASVAPSGIREIFNLAVGRPDVVHLEVGEPDFATPAHIVDAAFASARAGTGYTQTAGLLELREVIASRLARVHSLSYATDQIQVTHGGAQAIATIVAATIGDGDEVLIPDPAWPNYEMLVRAHGGTPVFYGLRAANGFIPDPDEVRALITGRTKLLVVNSPSNPTGAVIGEEVLDQLVAHARSAGVLVVSDEVYDEISFDRSPAPSATTCDPEWVVGVWSCSKTYAMTGWRVGYLAAPRSLAPTLVTLQEPAITCVTSVSQAAAMAAITGPQRVVGQMRDAYRRRRDLVLTLAEQAGLDLVKPQGAFYAMLPLAPGADSRRAAIDLVESGVALAPGSAFGAVAADHLRISLAASEEALGLGLERLLGWLEDTDGGAHLSGGDAAIGPDYGSVAGTIRNPSA